MARKRREAPWWTRPGSERCPACLMAYHVEVEYRCTACDGPLCPDCAATRLTAEIELFCTDCERPTADATEVEA